MYLKPISIYTGFGEIVVPINITNAGVLFQIHGQSNLPVITSGDQGEKGQVQNIYMCCLFGFWVEHEWVIICKDSNIFYSQLWLWSDKTVWSTCSIRISSAVSIKK